MEELFESIFSAVAEIVGNADIPELPENTAEILEKAFGSIGDIDINLDEQSINQLSEMLSTQFAFDADNVKDYLSIINSVNPSSMDITDIDELTTGEISFTGVAPDVAARDAAKSELIKALNAEHINYPHIYQDDLYGGVDNHTANGIRRAINNARNSNSISDSVYNELIKKLGKASH